MKKLNTGWKQWDKFLYKYIGKNLNIMEVGVYEGIATSWFLNNLMTNKNSIIYAIDSFKGSVEYGDNKFFSKIKKKFINNIKNTGKKNQVILMEMYSLNALNKLISENNIKFDIIFIDASHQANDVISDAILSWNLLKNNGILIFDDYKWDLTIEDHDKPKLAIDSFIAIYKPYINILYKGYQVIIKKKKLNIIDKPIVKYKINNEINILYNKVIYKLLIINIPTHNNKINYNIKFNNKINNKFIIKKIWYDNNNIIFKPNLLISSRNYIHNKKYFTNNIKIYNKFNKYLVSNKLKNISIIQFFFKKYWLSCYFENLMFLLKNNNLKNNINILNFSYVYDYVKIFPFEKLDKDNKPKLLDILNITTKQILHIERQKHINFKYYDISCTSLLENKNIYLSKYIYYKNIIHNRLHLKNLNNYLNIANSLKGKIDIINLPCFPRFKSNTQNEIKIYLFAIVFILIIQKKNGSSLITLRQFNINYKIVKQLIYILCKYYSNIKLKLNLCTSNTSEFSIYCHKYKGISKNELNNLINYCYKSNLNNIYLEQIFDDKMNNNFIKKYNDFIKLIHNNNKNEYNMIKRILKIEETLILHNYTKILDIFYIKIFNKQLNYIFEWFNKIFGSKYYYKQLM